MNSLKRDWINHIEVQRLSVKAFQIASLTLLLLIFFIDPNDLLIFQEIMMVLTTGIALGYSLSDLLRSGKNIANKSGTSIGFIFLWGAFFLAFLASLLFYYCDTMAQSIATLLAIFSWSLALKLDIAQQDHTTSALSSSEGG